jgi:hypothetical protein
LTGTLTDKVTAYAATLLLAPGGQGSQ